MEEVKKKTYLATSRGNFNNLRYSTYIYNYCNIDFYFSSKYKMECFKDKIVNEQQSLKQKLKNMNIHLDSINLFASLIAYEKWEKRGFFIKHKGVEYDCLTEISLKLELRKKIS